MKDSMEDSKKDIEDTDTPPDSENEDGDFVAIFPKSPLTEEQRSGIQFLLLVMFRSVRQTSQFMLLQSS